MTALLTFVVALAGGRREMVQPFDLVGAQLDAVGGGVLCDAGTLGAQSITLSSDNRSIGLSLAINEAEIWLASLR